MDVLLLELHCSCATRRLTDPEVLLAGEFSSSSVQLKFSDLPVTSWKVSLSFRGMYVVSFLRILNTHLGNG